MRRNIHILFLIIFALGCKEETRYSIDLSLKDSECFAFDNQTRTFPFLFLNNRYDTYYNSLKKDYRNIPNVDTFYFVTTYTDTRSFLHELKRRNLIDQSTFRTQVKRLRTDNLHDIDLDSKSVTHNIITGFDRGEHFYLIDKNSNWDFSDDNKVFTNRVTKVNDSCNSGNGRKFEEFTLSYLIDNRIETYSRKISITNQPDYYVFQKLKDTTAKSLALVGRFKDYWAGEIRIDEQEYNVIVQGTNSNNTKIYIQNDSLNFDQYDQVYNDNFKYSLGDTLKLSDYYFTIDSISSPINSLYISRLNSIPFPKNPTGHRVGERILDYRIPTLDGKVTSVYKNNNKSFLLLDFWGTWCIPCLELTADIKYLYDKNIQKLNIVGIAIDESNEKVRNYTSKNHMNWTQSYYHLRDKAPILRDLRISGYPTYILINSNNEIIYRGSTELSIKEIDRLVNKSNN